MASESESAVRSILTEFDNNWTYDSRDLARPTTEEFLRAAIAKFPGDRRRRLEEEFFGCGPLSALLTDEAVNEIVINGAHEIWFEKGGAFQALEDKFNDALTYRGFIDRLCGEAGIKVDLAKPFADGRWREFRVHLGCAPMTHADYLLTLRRIRSAPWTMDDLKAGAWATDEQFAVLQDLIDQKKNLIFIGPTGCGKTSVLGACLKRLPANERVVTIEDTDELPRANSASSKLLTRTAGMGDALPEITLTDLVRQSLRMRPERVVMGEVRGGEAKDLLLALATGHGGSLATLHASDARQALLRLEMLVQMGAPQWNVQAIRQLIHLSVDTVVVCGFENGKRKLRGAHRIAGLESFGFLLEQIA